MTMRAPWPASRSAAIRPMPVVAPVMTTTLPRTVGSDICLSMTVLAIVGVCLSDLRQV